MLTVISLIVISVAQFPGQHRFLLQFFLHANIDVICHLCRVALPLWSLNSPSSTQWHKSDGVFHRLETPIHRMAARKQWTGGQTLILSNIPPSFNSLTDQSIQPTKIPPNESIHLSNLIKEYRKFFPLEAVTISTADESMTNPIC